MAEFLDSGRFKYTKLRDKLRTDILSGRYQPGERFPSENELCAKHRLSNNTVREAILSLANEGLVCRTKGKGTFVTDFRLVRRTLALVIPRLGGDPLAYDYDIMPSYVAAIESEAHEMGWDVLLHVYNHNHELERQRLMSTLDRGVDGVISFFSCCYDNHDCIEAIESAGIPIVLVDAYIEGVGSNHVSTNDYHGSYSGTMELIKAGFERVCYFNSDHGDWNPITPRRKGYEAAMKDSGKYPHVLYPITSDDDNTVSWESRGYEMAKQMLSYIQHPFAIFAVTPALAIGAWRALTEADVPMNAIALGCFDNPGINFPEELLTVNVVQPVEQIGRRAVQIVMERVNGSATHCNELIEPEIVVAGTEAHEGRQLISTR